MFCSAAVGNKDATKMFCSPSFRYKDATKYFVTPQSAKNLISLFVSLFLISLFIPVSSINLTLFLNSPLFNFLSVHSTSFLLFLYRSHLFCSFLFSSLHSSASHSQKISTLIISTNTRSAPSKSFIPQ